ncbi:MAG: RNHCP domain-containing protein [Patescibacteria group bacterium]
MTAKRFQKKVEDFVCEYCQTKVKGTGYTDHCHYCLCSKHVDINPGDRQADCGGKMVIVHIEFIHSKYALHYKCQKCGFEKRNKLQAEDNMDKLISIQQEINDAIVKK